MRSPLVRREFRWLTDVATRIMLADDHLVVRQGLRSLREHSGFEVVAEAADGHEAVKLARAVLFDVAVLDICMPKMDGIDTAREILAVAPGSRIVMLTVHAEEPQIAARCEPVLADTF